MHNKRRSGFTIVELLVVITIIVVLLALLMPAMDKSIYQAELAACGAKLKALSIAASTYVMDNKRHYPFRSWIKGSVNERPNLLAYMVYAPAIPYDDRPLLGPYFSINKTLNCPLTQEVNLELPDTDPDTSPYSPYALWFGFGYRGHQGLRKLGDRFEYLGDRFDVLAGDWDGTYEDVQSDINTHPDHDRRMDSYLRENSYFAVVTLKHSYSAWQSPAGVRRGLVDVNHAFTDGAVVRYNDVKKPERGAEGDSRLVNVPPRMFGDDTNVWRAQIPQR